MDVHRSSRSAFLLAICLGAVAVAAPAPAVDEAPKPPSITVVGVGRERGTPDTVQLQFAVEHSAPTARAASLAAAKSASQVIEALREEVGDDGRVETRGFNLSPVYSREPERPSEPKVGLREPVIVGYTAVNQVAVETRRVESVGAMIDGAIAAGAARINNLSFTVRDPAPLQARTLRAAGADAAAQAAAIAEALNVRLTGVLEAATEGLGLPIPQPYSGVAMHAEAAMVQTPIEPGEVTTDVRVRVKYGIE